MSRGPGTPSRDLTSVVLCSSRMMSMHSSTHSSQMNTVGPAISLRTSCWLLPQHEQYSVFLESLPLDLVIATPSPAPRGTPWDAPALSLSKRRSQAEGARPTLVSRAKRRGTPDRRVYVLAFDQQLVKSLVPLAARPGLDDL